jgi:hypothetical protein
MCRTCSARKADVSRTMAFAISGANRRRCVWRQGGCGGRRGFAPPCASALAGGDRPRVRLDEPPVVRRTHFDATGALVRPAMRRGLLWFAWSAGLLTPPPAGVAPIRRRPSGPSPDRGWMTCGSGPIARRRRGSREDESVGATMPGTDGADAVTGVGSKNGTSPGAVARPFIGGPRKRGNGHVSRHIEERERRDSNPRPPA